MNEYFIKRPLSLWWLTALLICINAGLFLFELLHGMSLTDPSIVDLLRWGADFTPLTMSVEPWRLISSMFLHIGIIHLLVNMCALYLFGLYAEFYYGRWFYLLVYLSAGIAGNLLSNWINVHQALSYLPLNTALPTPGISGGASGAIMGVGGALLIAALLPNPHLPEAFRLNQKALITLMLINLGIGFVIPGINSMAHIGGFIVGVLLASVYRFSMNLSKVPQLILRLAMIPACVIGLGFLFQQLLRLAQPLHSVWQINIF
jgi:membrane associated rhomboid family serine protease